MATVEVMPQCMAALQQANRTRRDGADVKALIAKGELTVEHALGDPRAASLMVRDLLKAQPKWGDTKTARVLSEHHVLATRRVRMLTQQQRRALILACANPGPPLDEDMRKALGVVVDAGHSMLSADVADQLPFLRWPDSTLRGLKHRGLVESHREPWARGRLCWSPTAEGRRVAGLS